MIFLKIFNLGAIFLLCIYIGYYKAKLCEERVIELQKFLSGIMVFKNKVEFTYEPINCIFEDISNLISSADFKNKRSGLSAPFYFADL